MDSLVIGIDVSEIQCVAHVQRLTNQLRTQAGTTNCQIRRVNMKLTELLETSRALLHSDVVFSEQESPCLKLSNGSLSSERSFRFVVWIEMLSPNASIGFLKSTNGKREQPSYLRAACCAIQT